MYEMFVPTPDLLHTALQPIAQQVVARLLQTLGLTDMFGERISYESYGVTNATASDEHRNPTLVEDSLDVVLTYSHDKGDLPWPTAGSAIEYQELLSSPTTMSKLPKIFLDPDYNYAMVEYMRPCSITMELTFNVGDIVKAMDCMQRFRMALGNGVSTVDFDYNYIIPKEVLQTLGIFHKMAYGDLTGFVSSLKAGSNDAIEYLVNRDDNNDKALSVRKTITDALYGIDIQSDNPEPKGSGKSPSVYQLQLGVGTQFNMCNMVGLIYPIAIKNALLPEVFVNPGQRPIKRDEPENMFFDIGEFQKAIVNEEIDIALPIRRQPYYDNWLAPYMIDFIPFLIVVVTLDDIENPDGVTVLDLDATFKTMIPNVLEHIKTDGQKSMTFGSFINIAMYANNTQIAPTMLDFDPENLTLTVNERSTKPVYRLVLSCNPKAFGKSEMFRSLHTGIMALRNKRC